MRILYDNFCVLTLYVQYIRTHLLFDKSFVKDLPFSYLKKEKKKLEIFNRSSIIEKFFLKNSIMTPIHAC